MKSITNSRKSSKRKLDSNRSSLVYIEKYFQSAVPKNNNNNNFKWVDYPQTKYNKQVREKPKTIDDIKDFKCQLNNKPRHVPSKSLKIQTQKTQKKR